MDTTSVHFVLLFTGGQDSLLAAALLRAQGCQLTGLFVDTLTGCGQRAARERAARIDLPLRIRHADDVDVERLHTAWGHTDRLSNPCAVCRCGLLQAGGELLGELGADAVATGEVLGQRPSQGRMELLASAAAVGLQDRVLRPLSAKGLPPTALEQSGRIDRERLANLTGRGRKGQQALAASLGLGELPAPSEDCPLLSHEFAQRADDLLSVGVPSAAAFALLRLGRHFRFSPGAKVIVGRNAVENAALEAWLDGTAGRPLASDAVLIRPQGVGPTALACGPDAADAVRFAAGLIARFARWPVGQAMEVNLRTAAATELRSVLPDPAAWDAQPVGSS